jgi:hypothetical protein
MALRFGASRIYNPIVTEMEAMKAFTMPIAHGDVHTQIPNASVAHGDVHTQIPNVSVAHGDVHTQVPNVSVAHGDVHTQILNASVAHGDDCVKIDFNIIVADSDTYKTQINKQLNY